MAALLSGAGFQTTGELDAADVVVVNTCAFLHTSVQESIDQILEVGRLKEAGMVERIVVAGCAAERYREQLLAELPEVDALIGTAQVGGIVDVVREVLDGVDVASRPMRLGGFTEPMTATPRALATPRHTAYLKISEGCNHTCRYCIIPTLRGRQRSLPVATVIEEARRLAEDGVREISLIAQDTTNYGRDMGRQLLPELLAELDRIEGIEWIRLLYTHPALWSEPLIEATAALGAKVPYIDVPIQHVSDRMLRAMRRATTGLGLRRRLARLREALPHVALRSTVIVGFPGESEDDVNELVQFVSEFAFERLGCFTFSREEGTPAATLPDQVPASVKKARRARVMAAQQAVSAARNRRLVGRSIRVLVDEITGVRKAVGRTAADALEIDGTVRLVGEGLRTGMFVDARVTRAHAYDLDAAVLGACDETGRGAPVRFAV
jgi:ribosomal protein S12 methylthiotransferase